MTGTVQYQKLRENGVGNALKNTGAYKNSSKVDFSSLIVKAFDGTANQQKKPVKTEAGDQPKQEDKVNDKKDLKKSDPDTGKKDTQDLKPGEVILVADMNTSASTGQAMLSADLEGIYQQTVLNQEDQVHISTGSDGQELMIGSDQTKGIHDIAEDQHTQILDVNKPFISEQSLKALKVQSGIGEGIDRQTTTQKTLEELSKQFRTEDAAGQRISGQNELMPDSLRQAADDQDLLNRSELNKPIVETEDTDSDGSDLMLAESLKNQANPQETIKIKVAEPFRQVSTAMAENMGNKITHKIIEGVQEFHIQLMPENLGKISIKISVLETGIKVLMNCDNQKTLGLLTDRADVIGQIVERNTDTPVVVEVKEDNYWNQQKNATDQHKNQNQSDQRDNNHKKSDRAETSDFINQLRLGIYDNEKIV